MNYSKVDIVHKCVDKQLQDLQQPKGRKLNFVLSARRRSLFDCVINNKASLYNGVDRACDLLYKL